MFCQKDAKKVAINQVLTFKTSEKILRQVVFDRKMSCRLAGVTDLIASEGRYHLKCYTCFQRSIQKITQDNQDFDGYDRCFKEVMTLLERGLSQGHIYSVKAV